MGCSMADKEWGDHVTGLTGNGGISLQTDPCDE